MWVKFACVYSSYECDKYPDTKLIAAMSFDHANYRGL